MDNATEYMAGINPPSEVERLRQEVEGLRKALREAEAKAVDICPNCGRECDPTTCWCGDSHPKSYGDGGHSHIPMGCVCGYAENVERDHYVLKQMLLLARVERDKFKNELEALRRNLGSLACCSDPTCLHSNPRT